MIVFTVNNQQIAPSNFWYHYKDNNSATAVFEVKISRNESELIQLIKDYCKCDIHNPNIIEVIATLDSSKRSYGLMWHILNYAKKKNGESNSYDWEWVLNNVTAIAIDTDFVCLKGMATKYQENEY